MYARQVEPAGDEVRMTVNESRQSHSPGQFDLLRFGSDEGLDLGRRPDGMDPSALDRHRLSQRGPGDPGPDGAPLENQVCRVS